MGLYTAVLNLFKPSSTDTSDPRVDLSDNFEKIDDAVAADRDRIAALEAMELIPLEQRGAANGVATLDSNSKIPDVQIPSTIARDTEVASAVDTAIAALLAGAPGALDTLNELAAAIGDDANFAAAVTTSLAGKASSTDPRLTDQRTPLDGSVTTAKVAADAITPALVSPTVWLQRHSLAIEKISGFTAGTGLTGQQRTDNATAIAAAASQLGAGELLLPSDMETDAFALDLGRIGLIGRGPGASLIHQTAWPTRFITIGATTPGATSWTLAVDHLYSSQPATITFPAGADISAIAAGDVLHVRSGRPASSARLDFKVGELVVVDSVSGSGGATPTVVLRQGLRHNYYSADTVVVSKPAMLAKPILADFSIVNSAPSSTHANAGALWVGYAKDALVERVHFADLDGQALTFAGCLGGQALSVVVENSADSDANSQFGYGIVARDGTTRMRITHAHVRRARHAVTTDGGAYGGAVDLLVNDSVAELCSQGGFDTHQDSIGVWFRDCDAIDCGYPSATDTARGGSSVSGFGFQLRSKESGVEGGRTERCEGGIRVYEDAIGATIRDHTIRHLYDAFTAAAIDCRAADQVSILDVLVEGVKGVALKLSGSATATYRFDNFLVDGLRVLNSGMGSSGTTGQAAIQFDANVRGTNMRFHRIEVEKRTYRDFGSTSPSGAQADYQPQIGALAANLKYVFEFLAGATVDGTFGDIVYRGLTGGLSTGVNAGTFSARGRQRDSTNGVDVFAALGIPTKAGAPSDADFPAAPPDGTMVYDVTNKRLYTRAGDWSRYVQLGVSGQGVQIDVFTAGGTWTKPFATGTVQVAAVAGGGGGGSGRKGAAGTVRNGGGGGGGGGVSAGLFMATDLGATETVTVGAGGAGGAAVAAADTDGNAGGAGGASSFGASPNHWVRAGGAGGGGGGTNAAGTAGAASGAGISGGAGGAASATGGAGAGGGNTGGAGGGGAGGGVTAANAANAGGPGGVTNARGGQLQSAGAAAGASAVASTLAVAASSAEPGNGGGGGGGSITGDGGAGAAGTKYGGGGGGGGAAVNAVGNSGAGGAGGDGIVVVIARA